MPLKIAAGLKPGPLYRTFGNSDSRELVGAGYMRKLRIGSDHINLDPGYYSISYLYSGRGRYVDSWGRTHRLEGGCYFQRFPGYVHTSYIEEGEEWLELFVDIGPQLTASLVTMGILDPRQPCGVIGDSEGLAQSMLDFRMNLETAPEEELRFLVPQALTLIQRVLSAGRQSASGEDRDMVRLACRLLGCDWRERLDIEEMCREHGWGYERFRKVFRAAIGIPPAQYRIRRRIDEARRLLLAHPELSIKDIAEELGYPSVYEFSAQFTRTVGLPPGRFRRGQS